MPAHIVKPLVSPLLPVFVMLDIIAQQDNQLRDLKHTCAPQVTCASQAQPMRSSTHMQPTVQVALTSTKIDSHLVLIVQLVTIASLVQLPQSSAKLAVTVTN